MLKQIIWISAIAAIAVWCRSAAGSARNYGDAKAREGENTASSFEANVDQQWRIPRKGASHLYVRTPSGAIRTAATEGDQIQIQATKQVRGPSEREAQQFLDQMKIEQRREGDGWIIEATWPEPAPAGIQAAQVSFEISAPPGMRLEATSGNGPVEAVGATGATLRTASGDIRARAVAGRLSGQTGNGSMEIDRCEGAVEAVSSSGGITIHRIEHTLKAKTGYGPIWIEGCAGSLEAHSSSGGIVIRQARDRVNASTGNGSVQVEMVPGSSAVQVALAATNGIDLGLPGNVSARVAADSDTGRFAFDLPGASLVRRSFTHAEAVLGNGQGSACLHTSDGVIRIRVVGSQSGAWLAASAHGSCRSPIARHKK